MIDIDKMNKVTFIGNLGKDAESWDFDNGGCIVNFSLATTERGYTTSDGKTIEDKTDWHNCVIKKKGLTDVAKKYLKKGMKVYVCGKLTYREYEKDGTKHRITEIVVDELELLTPKGDGGNNQSSHPDEQPTQKPIDSGSDGLPF